MWSTNQDIQPSRTSGSLGDFGLSARWSPEWLDGTLGFYYRNTTDITPQVMVDARVAPHGACGGRARRIGGIPLPGGTLCFINPQRHVARGSAEVRQARHVQLTYGDNIHIYGVSLSKQIVGLSVGAELSYRENMPLVSQPVQVLPAALVPLVPGSVATTTDLGHGTPGALGDTWHGLINAISILPRTFLFDTATFATELTWSNGRKSRRTRRCSRAVRVT